MTEQFVDDGVPSFGFLLPPVDMSFTLFLSCTRCFFACTHSFLAHARTRTYTIKSCFLPSLPSPRCRKEVRRGLGGEGKNAFCLHPKLSEELCLTVGGEGLKANVAHYCRVYAREERATIGQTLLYLSKWVSFPDKSLDELLPVISAKCR